MWPNKNETNLNRWSVLRGSSMGRLVLRLPLSALPPFSPPFRDGRSGPAGFASRRRSRRMFATKRTAQTAISVVLVPSLMPTSTASTTTTTTFSNWNKLRKKERNQTKKSHPSHVGEVKQKGRGFAFENLASRIVVNILLLFVYPIRIDLGHISWRHQHFYIWFHSSYQLPFQNGKTWTAKIFLRLRNPVAPMMNGGSQWRQTDNVRLVCVIEKKKRTKSNNHNTIHKSDKIW